MLFAAAVRINAVENREASPLDTLSTIYQNSSKTGTDTIAAEPSSGLKVPCNASDYRCNCATHL